ncbi:MAG: L,D-transpeptidase [Ignavibacteria bacterium]|jgi:murein L,D-transpeptidase YafK|nr:L,D-transpeptidase [Ignavibacteria bacterium]
MIKQVFFFSGGIVLFLLGCIVYGIIINVREQTIEEAMNSHGISTLENVHIVVEQSTYSLNLFSDSILVKKYRAAFGRIKKSKSIIGEKATPIGSYKICEIDSSHIYGKFFRLNYPNLEDAERGLLKKKITQKEFDQLKFEYYYGKCPNNKTALGGNIGIHGSGKLDYLIKNLPFVFNWTDGSVAVSNQNIDELYKYVKEGTVIVINP